MKIKEVRIKLKLERKTVCEYVDIPYRTYEKWEREERIPPEYIKNMIIFIMRKMREDIDNGINKKYFDCIREDGDCESCSLVNYGRDCHNNKIEV
ncbi:helix-turn-helix transcriptional regulator [uncultured Anaerofustis sp.]|uniref:helix-turn-helix domain-containing protein n=1 Tax=uncultured Anaerofustis sp. TaxID=904996 RepID=UPI0025D5D15F|nr:helix-turn-helix transcriptional regulator [uncultured Anaerofustis sp.]